MVLLTFGCASKSRQKGQQDLERCLSISLNRDLPAAITKQNTESKGSCRTELEGFGMHDYMETQLEPGEIGLPLYREGLCVGSFVWFNCVHLCLVNRSSFTELCSHSVECMLPNFRVKPVPHWQVSISSSIK